MNVRFKILMYFLFGYSADFHIIGIHRKISQIVQITEYAHFTEFGYSGEKGQFDVAIHTFQHTIERFQLISVHSL